MDQQPTKPKQPPGKEDSSTHPIRSILGGILIVGVIYLVLRYWDQSAFQEWKRDANPFVFFGLLSVLPAVAVPTTPFFILAGATFSPWIAILGSAVGVGLSNLLCWLIAQSWLRDRLVRLLTRFGYNLPDLERGKAIRIALLIKFAPGLPTVVKNYVMALSGISFWVYLGISWSVTMVYASAFILLGESFVEQDFKRAIPPLVVLILVGILFYLVRRRLEKQRREAL